MEDYELKMLEILDSGKRLDEDQLADLVYEFNEIERECGDNRRWSRGVESIIEIGERYFCVEWEEGLTENQPNGFYNQPYEVAKHTYEKTITVTEWKPIKANA